MEIEVGYISLGAVISMAVGITILWAKLRKGATDEATFKTDISNRIEHLEVWKEEHETASVRKLDEIKAEIQLLKLENKEDKESQREDRAKMYAMLHNIVKEFAEFKGELIGAGVLNKHKD